MVQSTLSLLRTQERVSLSSLSFSICLITDQIKCVAMWKLCLQNKTHENCFTCLLSLRSLCICFSFFLECSSSRWRASSLPYLLRLTSSFPKKGFHKPSHPKCLLPLLGVLCTFIPLMFSLFTKSTQRLNLETWRSQLHNGTWNGSACTCPATSGYVGTLAAQGTSF